MPLNRFFILLCISLLLSSCLDTRPSQVLYNDLLGEQIGNCTKILFSQDRGAIDAASAYIHFTTCPKEVKRILKQRRYEIEVISNKLAFEEETVTFGGVIPKWWKPSKLGDSCYRYTYFGKDTDWAEYIYISKDSTAVYYRDDRW